MEEWQVGARPRPTTSRTGARNRGQESRSQSGAAALRHTDERFDDFAIRQQWRTGDALPEATVVRRELAGIPRIEVPGVSKDKVEELFWDTVTEVRAELTGVSRK